MGLYSSTDAAAWRQSHAAGFQRMFAESGWLSVEMTVDIAAESAEWYYSAQQQSRACSSSDSIHEVLVEVDTLVIIDMKSDFVWQEICVQKHALFFEPYILFMFPYGVISLLHSYEVCVWVESQHGILYVSRKILSKKTIILHSLCVGRPSTTSLQFIFGLGNCAYSNLWCKH